MKTREQRREEYRAKERARKAQLKIENEWFEYKMHLCYDDDYFVWDGQFEFIRYQDKYTDKKFHVDFFNGMHFTATTYEETEQILEAYL